MNDWASAEHALAYLERADSIPHRSEGEGVVLELLAPPPLPRRVLDLGTGDGRLLALVKAANRAVIGVALDKSPTVLDAARARFGDEGSVSVLEHDLDLPLPSDIGTFDAVVSSFAIHHCEHERKRRLYDEVFALLEPGDIFCNLDHVASPTRALHEEFLAALGIDEEDPSNRLLDVETQLGWLRAIGFDDVDCYWKWRELALMAGLKRLGTGGT